MGTAKMVLAMLVVVVMTWQAAVGVPRQVSLKRPGMAVPTSISFGGMLDRPFHGEAQPDLAPIASPASYYVTFATTVRPGVTLPVMVRLVNEGDVSTVSVSLRNGSEESQVFAETEPVTVHADGMSHIMNLEIPRGLKKQSWRDTYKVYVVAEGDVTFNQSRTVALATKSFSIFVQTDKAAYKPGETVKFRALAMNPDLTVLREPMHIFIKDPKKNGVKQWRNVSGVHGTGVIERSFPLSDFAALGDWKMQVTVLGMTEEKAFTVKKYVLPKFETILEIPSTVQTSVPFLRGMAMAKYTFGKPLTEGKVMLTLQYRYFWNKYNNSTKPSIVKYGQLDSKGEYEIKVSREELQNLTYYNHPYMWSDYRPSNTSLNHRVLNVMVNITDGRTGHQMGSNQQVTFSPFKADMQFLTVTPNNFKPGLTFSAYLSVKKMDGSLFEDYSKINVTFNFTMTVPKPTTTTTTTTTPLPSNLTLEDEEELEPLLPGERIPYVHMMTVVLDTFNKTPNADGFISVDFEAPTSTNNIKISASAFGTVETTHYLTKAKSPTGNFIQIQPQTKNPKVGQQLWFLIKTTEKVHSVHCQVYSKMILLNESELLPLDKDGRHFNLTFVAKATMAPLARILVFYVRPTGEVVPDTISIKIDSSTDQRLQLSYDREQVKPGEEVQLKVMAPPNSVVFFLAVDKSVQLLKSGNDITKDLVENELVFYDYGDYFPMWGYMRICGWPSRSDAVYARDVFENARVAIFTDGIVTASLEVDIMPFQGLGFTEARDGAGTMIDGGTAPLKKGQSALESSEVKLRSNFPETWLFQVLVVGPEGHAVLQKTAPDTITTWLTSAFAVHPQQGLSVVEKPAELTTFRNVFVSLDLPYSAIRGEDLCMKAFAFNYHEKPIFVRMVMGRSAGISNIGLDWDRGEYRVPRKVSHRIGKVDPNDVRETTFCFTPNTLGSMPIRVDLLASRMPGDAVQRMLLVEPEGVPRTQTFPVILDVKDGDEFRHINQITFPDEAVSGSQRIRVSVAGDLLGPVMDNIDDLLRMPYGCGEQNMLYFAPNVFLIDYLQETNTYTEELAEKAERYMIVGYQKEMQYQHLDGSFSAFGNSDKNSSGSMWLTAFVTKCFVQSMALEGEVITIEPGIVRRSIEWMISRQLKDGSFPEPGKVFNKNMQGGSAKGEALTAYVVIALVEADAHFVDITKTQKRQLQNAIQRGRMFLEYALETLDDPYDLAIVTYVLHLTNSTKAEAAFDQLKQKAIIEPLATHWERPKPDAQPLYYYWQRQTDAINIEMTAYALLTYIKRDDVIGAMPIVRWMTLQKGSQGGFISTQDTVLGLQALSQIAVHLYQPTFSPLTVTVDWSVMGKQHTKTLTVDGGNKLLMQKVDVPIERNMIPEDVSIRASTVPGSNVSAMAVAEVTLYYNVLKPTAFKTYNLTPEVTVHDDQHFILDLTASRVDGKTGSMTLIEAGIPTGYTVDKEHPAYDTTGSKMVEEQDRKFIIYYEELDKMAVKARLPMEVTQGIPVNTLPTPVRIYDYYENGGDQQMTVNYELPKVGFICDRQPKYEACPFI